MAQEIERKWLVDSLPREVEEALAKGQYDCSEIIQGYLCTDPVVRVRKYGSVYTLTYKSKGILSREEYELELTETAFDHLLPKCDGIILRKDRCRIPLASEPPLVIDLDIFHGEYEGRIYAEVEFPDLETAERFVPPLWFGREVTGEKGFSNAALSLANTH